MRMRLAATAAWFLLAAAGTAGAQEHDCMIEARQNVEIRSPVEGLIEVERARELNRQQFVSASALDEAEAEYKLASEDLRRNRENQRLAEVEVTRARAALELRTIRSPFNGVVVEVLLRPGELAATATVKNPVMKLAEIDPLHVEVVLPGKLFGSIHRGQVATVLPEAPLQGSFRSTVTVVDRVIDGASGTFGVRLELPNRQGKLPAGMRCRVRFQDAPSPAPRSAG
jgi:RND family efflux transporter MFP subunit